MEDEHNKAAVRGRPSTDCSRIETPRTDAAWAAWPYAGPGMSIHVGRELERENHRLRVALRDCREMAGEMARDEINAADELQKWDRAFLHLIPENDQG
jgi:hypothetical protein